MMGEKPNRPSGGKEAPVSQCHDEYEPPCGESKPVEITVPAGTDCHDSYPEFETDPDECGTLGPSPLAEIAPEGQHHA